MALITVVPPLVMSPSAQYHNNAGGKERTVVQFKNAKEEKRKLAREALGSAN